MVNSISSFDASVNVSDRSQAGADINAKFDYVGSMREMQTTSPRGAAQTSGELDMGNVYAECGCKPEAGPQANLSSLYKAEGNFTFAHKEMQDALDALRAGNSKEGMQEIRDALQAINSGMQNTRDGVGGDFDLSKQPESDPLRRVGSGRQAIRAGRNDLDDALKALNGDCPDFDKAIRSVEAGLGHVLGGTANINKAVGLIEHGAKDHRPRENGQPSEPSDPEKPKCVDSPTEPKELPRLEHSHELHTGQRHLGKALGSLRESLGEITGGDFHHAHDELKGALKQLASATKDFHYAFGGELPGKDAFSSAESSIFKAFKNLKESNFEDSMADIRKAIKRLNAGGSEINEARDQSR